MPEDKHQVGITLYGPPLAVNPLLLWLVRQLDDAHFDQELTEVRDDDDGSGRTACLVVKWGKP